MLPFKMFRTSRQKQLSERDLKGDAEIFAEEYASRQQERVAKKKEKQDKRHAGRRQADRRSCFTIADLEIKDQGFTMQGMVCDISPGGATFRPASHYLMKREGQRIQLIVDDIVRSGIIRSTRPDGYGIQILDPFTDKEIQRVVSASANPSMFDAA